MSIFSKIISGEIPSHKIYGDDLVFAFLDINPLSPGHTLVVPKQQVETLDQLSDDSAAAIGRCLPRLARAIIKATGAQAYNILQNNGPLAGQEVMHVHFHIIPRQSEEVGLGRIWVPGSLDTDQGKAHAQSIIRHLES